MYKLHIQNHISIQSGLIQRGNLKHTRSIIELALLSICISLLIFSNTACFMHVFILNSRTMVRIGTAELWSAMEHTNADHSSADHCSAGNLRSNSRHDHGWAKNYHGSAYNFGSHSRHAVHNLDHSNTGPVAFSRKYETVVTAARDFLFGSTAMLSFPTELPDT